jgi:hypothetical protein
MKKLSFILFLAVFFNQLLSAQVNTDTTRRTPISDRELGLQYLKKANSQRTVGWVLLGAGIAMEILSIAIVANDLYDDGTGAETLFLVGGLATIASVPVFISGAKNRGRAEILLRHENIRVYNNNGSGKEGVVSLALSIPLSRSRK